MKRSRDLLALCLLFFGLVTIVACSSEEQGSDGSDTVDRVEAHFSAAEEAWSTGEASQVGEFFAEDAVRIASSLQQPLYGRDAISQAFAPFLDQAGGEPRLSIDLIEARAMTEELIMAVGEWEVSNGEQRYTGAVLQVLRAEGQSLSIIFENSVAYDPTTDFSQVEREYEQVLTGDGLGASERLVENYLSLLNAGDIAGLSAQVFEEDGIQISETGVLRGREALATGIQPPPEGVHLTAQPYGYLSISEDLVLNWGGYQIENSDGELLGFGQWGNLERIVDGDLILVVEAAGLYFDL